STTNVGRPSSGSRKARRPLLPSVSDERGALAPRRDRLQPRQPAASAVAARRDPRLVPHESPAAAAQDRGTADPARTAPYVSTRRKSLDEDALSTDSGAHGAAGVQPDMIEWTAPTPWGGRREPQCAPMGFHGRNDLWESSMMGLGGASARYRRLEG